MSITFSVANAPRQDKRTVCLCAQMAPLWLAAYDGGVPLDEAGLADHAWAKCPQCGGTGIEIDSEPVWPECNLANENGQAILGILGRAFSPNGVLEGQDLDVFVGRLFVAVNSAKRRAPAIREPYTIDGGHGGVSLERDGNVVRIERMGERVIGMGYDDETVIDRLNRLLAVCRKAKAEGRAVIWG